MDLDKLLEVAETVCQVIPHPLASALLKAGKPWVQAKSTGLPGQIRIICRRSTVFVKPKEPAHPRGYIAADGEICSGCRTCEAVCSLIHESAVSPRLSRIEVKSWPFEGYRSEVYTCQQCEDPLCLSACPTGALRRAGGTNAIVIEKDECTGCQSCREACPYIPSRIRYDDHANVCIKCDLCGGTPLCVKYCMEGALRFQQG